MLTPHIVRSLDITADDLRPMRMPREGSGSAIIEPAFVPPPPAALPPRDPANPPTPPTQPPAGGAQPQPGAPSTPTRPGPDAFPPSGQ
jgi:hypothetical protein